MKELSNPAVFIPAALGVAGLSTSYFHSMHAFIAPSLGFLAIAGIALFVLWQKRRSVKPSRARV